MIQSITLRNFQSHKDTVLELSSGVNVLVGKSDSGKSAIIRALEWLRTNRPSGEAFRSHWGGEAEVSVALSNDGQGVTRSKGDKTNQYTVGEAVYKAMGQGVPPDVAEVLGIEDISVQHQHDSPFLLPCSPGEVARVLNRFAKLDKIDSAQQHLASQIRRYKEVATAAGMAEAESKRAADAIGDLSGVSSALEDAERLDALLLAVERRRTGLTGLLEGMSAVETELRLLPGKSELAELSGKIAAVEGMARGLCQTDKERKALERLIYSLEWSGTTIDAAKDELAKAERELAEATPNTCPLCGGKWKERK